MAQTNKDCRFRNFTLTNSPHQQHLLVGRQDSKLRYALVHNFIRKLCLDQKKWSWLTQWMISNLRVLSKELLVQTLSFSTRELLQHWTKSSRIPALRKRSVWRKSKLKRRPLPPRKTDRLPDLPVLPGHWSQCFCRELCRPIYSCSSKWRYSGIRFEVGWNSIINDTNPIWWHLGKLVQIENTRVWETQDRPGIVQHGKSWEEGWTWQPQIEDNGKKKYRAELRMKNFEVRNGNYETKRRAVVKNQGTKQCEQRSLGDCWQWKANGQCSKGDNCSFRHDMNKRAKSRKPNPLQDLLRSRVWKMHREPEVLEAEAQVGKWLDCRARITSEELAQLHSVKNGILRSACSTSQKKGCRFGEKCSYAHR